MKGKRDAPTHTEVRRKVAIDFSGVRSASVRRKIERLLKEIGVQPRTHEAFWDVAEGERPVDLPCGLVVVSDLSHCAATYRAAGRLSWASRVRTSRSFILALVRTERDAAHVALVDDLIHAARHRLMVCEFNPSRVGDLIECLERSIAGTEPSSLVDARYSPDDSALWVEFGDGRTSAVEWKRLGVDEESLELVLHSATVSEDLGAVQVLTQDGEVFDIDAAALRAIVDKEERERLTATSRGSREGLGLRARRKREGAQLTQDELGRRTGLDQALISKLEGGKHRPRWDTLARYAGGLGMTVRELLA